MLANPIITNYKPFYIQYGDNTTATDTRSEWGMIAKVNPFPALPTPKEPYSNKWLDENGVEEYTDEMFYDSFEFAVSFYIRARSTVVDNVVTETSTETIRKNMNNFFNAIKKGSFMIYDSYTGLGRRDVRYAGFAEEEFKSRREDGTDRSEDWAYTIFKITFKVNDPITFMTLRNGAIVEI